MEYTKIIHEGLGGKIKSLPRDFIVEEMHEDYICTITYTLKDKIKKFFAKGNGNFLHFTLIKDKLNTFQAIGMASNKLRASKKRFGVCGNKDKFAITSQRVSFHNGNHNDLKKINVRGIKIKDISYANFRLNPGNLKGNRFVITIRDIPHNKDEITKKLNHYSIKLKGGIPNYFGVQRFGEKRAINQLVGEEIINENYEKAVKILLTTTGNESEEATKAREFLSSNWGNYSESLKLFPPYLDIEIKVLNSLLAGKSFRESLFSLPPQIKDIFVHSYQSYLFNKKLDNMIRNGLVSKTILLAPLKSKDINYRGYERATMLFPKNFKIISVKNGEATISFELNKGSYATILLDELIN